MNTEILTYIQAQENINKIKQNLVDELIDSCGQKKIARAVTEGSLLHVINFKDMNGKWGVDNYMGSSELPHEENLRIAIMSSKDLIRTLSNIVHNKNVTNYKSYYFCKLPMSYVNSIRLYLGDNLIPKSEKKKRNISSYPSKN
jgi:hypothetical protein